MIKESSDLAGWKVQLVIPNQKLQSQVLPFFIDYLHTKNVRDSLIPSRDMMIKESCKLLG